MMSLRCLAGEAVARAAIRADRLAVPERIEEDARVARPQRRNRLRAVQRQVVCGNGDAAGGIDILSHFQFPQTLASQSLRAGTLPFTTSKNRLWIFSVTGPRLPAPIWRLSTSRIGVTSAAVPVKKASSAM